MSKKKKQIILSVIILAVLAAAITILAVLNRPQELPESGTVSVTSSGIELASFNMEQLQQLDSVQVQKEIVSSSFKNDEGLFCGVALRTLLAAADVDTSSASQVIVRSEDGFVAAFPIDDVMESDNIFLAYSKNGNSLGSLADGGSGPYRIIVTEDEFGNRCAKYVAEIEVK